MKKTFYIKNYKDIYNQNIYINLYNVSNFYSRKSCINGNNYPYLMNFFLCRKIYTKSHYKLNFHHFKSNPLSLSYNFNSRQYHNHKILQLKEEKIPNIVEIKEEDFEKKKQI